TAEENTCGADCGRTTLVELPVETILTLRLSKKPFNGFKLQLKFKTPTNATTITTKIVLKIGLVT
ncbi:MAG: hypothetical protein ACXVAX_06975, partial [Pseudobdellovibrio sp.]